MGRRSRGAESIRLIHNTTIPTDCRIGHIEVEIPWSQLGRKAVVIKVEGVHVLAYAKYQVRNRADLSLVDSPYPVDRWITDNRPHKSPKSHHPIQ